jgi:hypothetical protein
MWAGRPPTDRSVSTSTAVAPIAAASVARMESNAEDVADLTDRVQYAAISLIAFSTSPDCGRIASSNAG